MTQQYQATSNNKFSNVQPIWKFCTLYIITMGIYQIPWAHRQWKFIKERDNLQIRPWFRSCFFGFYLYSLCQKTFALAEEQGYREKALSVQVTALFWTFITLGRLPDPLWLISLLAFVPLLTILKALNYYWEQQQPNLPKNESFTGREVIWIVVGAIFWLLGIIAMFASPEK